MRLTRCGVNTTTCGPVDTKGHRGCPAGCVDDGAGWCQGVMTTYVNRRPSSKFPLPTEGDPAATLNVLEWEALDITWKVSGNYSPPPTGSAAYPIGVQTTTYAPFSNKTWTYFGNEVGQQIGSESFPNAIETAGHPWAEVLGDGEFFPQVTYTASGVRGEDLMASQSHIINQNGATSGFEMCFAPSTLGAGGPNQNTSRIQIL